MTEGFEIMTECFEIMTRRDAWSNSWRCELAAILDRITKEKHGHRATATDANAQNFMARIVLFHRIDSF